MEDKTYTCEPISPELMTFTQGQYVIFSSDFLHGGVGCV